MRERRRRGRAERQARDTAGQGAGTGTRCLRRMGHCSPAAIRKIYDEAKKLHKLEVETNRLMRNVSIPLTASRKRQNFSTQYSEYYAVT